MSGKAPVITGAEPESIPPLYTIYKHPLDHPYEYVCRIWHGLHPEPQLFATSTTLDGLHAQLPKGLVNIGRQLNDDPVIIEVWI